jgi:hypothetical protein
LAAPWKIHGQWTHSKADVIASNDFLSASEIENFGGVLRNLLDPGVRRMGVRHWDPVLLPDLEPVQRSILFYGELTCLGGVAGGPEGLPYLTLGQWAEMTDEKSGAPRDIGPIFGGGLPLSWGGEPEKGG